MTSEVGSRKHGPETQAEGFFRSIWGERGTGTVFSMRGKKRGRIKVFVYLFVKSPHDLHVSLYGVQEENSYFERMFQSVGFCCH